jgi:hypothetical protein
MRDRSSGLVLDVASQVGGAMPSTTTLYDKSRAKIASTTMTNVTWSQLPSGLWAMNFNGTSSQILMDIAWSKALTGSSACTLLLWLNRVIGGSSSRVFIIQNTSGNSRVSLVSLLTTGELDIYARSDDEGPQTGYFPSTPTSGTWNFIAIVCDLLAQTVIGYLNCIATSRAEAFSNSSFQNNCDASFIGSAGGSSYLLGAMAKLRMLNYALSAAQIRAMYGAERRLFQ